jgi:mono/diheme cytochrome c family protein
VPIEDRFSLPSINATGVLRAASWSRLPADLATRPPTARAMAEGQEVFRLLCTSCHTIDGYLAVRPLVRNASPVTLDAMLARLAAPAEGSAWTDLRPGLRTWRSRRMPPLVGTPEERRSLAMYLSWLGGTSEEALGQFRQEGDPGARLFLEHCSMCHGAESDLPFDAKGRSADQLYEMLGRLTAISESMPPFEGSDVDRRALAAHLSTLKPMAKEGGR